MATVASNKVTPAQLALEKKKGSNPLLRLAGGLATGIGNAMFPGMGSAVQLGTQLYSASRQPGGATASIPQVPSPLPKPQMVNTLAPAAAPPKPPASYSPMAQAPQQQPQAPVPAQQQKPERQTSMPQSLLGTLLTELINRGKTAPQPSDIAESARRNEEIGKRAAGIADTYGREYADIGRKGAAAQAGYLSTGTSPVAEGNAAVIAQTQAAQQQAVAQGAQAAMTGIDKELAARGAETAGLTSAAGAGQSALGTATPAAAPVQVPYSNQLLDPRTGQTVGGGAQGQSLQDAVALQVQKIRSGAVGYNDGASALSAYGQAGVNALQQALGSGFDINASNANAAAKAAALGQNVSQGTQAARMTISAKQALDALQTAYDRLGALQTGSVPGVGNVPLLSQFEQFASMKTGLGREATSGFITALNEARAQVRGVLGAAGINPTDAGDIVDTLLPSGMKPQEVKDKIAAAKAYLDNRVAALSSTGNIPQYNTSGGNAAAGGGAKAPATGFSW
jgi:hypothetical protein